MDQDLRELERRVAQGEPGARERFLRARARARGVSESWVEFELSLELDPAPVRAAAEELLRKRLPELSQREPGYSHPVNEEYADVLQRAVARPWFQGLNEDWEPPWCPCHWLPRAADEVERCVTRSLEQIESRRALAARLVELGNARPGSDDELARAAHLRGLASDVLEAVIEATGCNDSWYGNVEPALSQALEGWGLDDAELEDTENLLIDRFDSWSQPGAEAVELFLDTFWGEVEGQLPERT